MTLTNCSRTSSGTLRVTLATLRAEECENITGARVVFNASRMVLLDTWLMSTNMPNRFISLIIVRPKAEIPSFVTGMLPLSLSDESALKPVKNSR